MIKNIVLGFTLAATIFLIVFIVELVLVNRGVENVPSGYDITVGTSESHEDSDFAFADIGDFGDDTMIVFGPIGIADDLYDDEYNLPQHTEPSRFELPMADLDLTLILYADENIFEFVEEPVHWDLFYRGTRDAALEIAFDFITSPGYIERLAEVFLNDYLDGGASMVIGEGPIGNSPRIGHAVVGTNDEGVPYEAWIHNLTGNQTGSAVVFVIHYTTQEQRAALHAIIDTFEMLSNEELNPPENEEYEDVAEGSQ
jgi:hypothetical protein